MRGLVRFNHPMVKVKGICSMLTSIHIIRFNHPMVKVKVSLSTLKRMIKQVSTTLW